MWTLTSSVSHRIWSDGPIHRDRKGLACFLWVAGLLCYHTVLQSLPGESHNRTEPPDFLVPQKANWTWRAGGHAEPVKETKLKIGNHLCIKSHSSFLLLFCWLHVALPLSIQPWRVSTVGFGDFVSGQREHHEDTRAYQVANCLLMLLGVCCTYSLFNAISVIIKQGLNWMLMTLAWMYSGVCRYRLQLRQLFTLCLPETSICYCEDNTLHRQQVQAVSSSGHGMVWSSCAAGKCLCDEAQVETVCSVNTHREIP